MQHVCLCQHKILDVTSDSVLQVRPSHVSATDVLLKGKQKFMQGLFVVFLLSVFNCIFSVPHICIVLEPVQPDMMCTACRMSLCSAYCTLCYVQVHLGQANRDTFILVFKETPSLSNTEVEQCSNLDLVEGAVLPFDLQKKKSHTGLMCKSFVYPFLHYTGGGG